MTRAPARRATAAISASSVDTKTDPTVELASSVCTARATSGCPAIVLRFLRGTPFDPPRAGMMAHTPAVLMPAVLVDTSTSELTQVLLVPRRRSARWRR
jgi:hypothetical protein